MMDTPPCCRGLEGPDSATEPCLHPAEGMHRSRWEVCAGKSKNILGWGNGLGQRISELSINVESISFHNYELRLRELSSDSGQMFQRGPWEQK